MRVDWCVSSWFRIKNTHTHTMADTPSLPGAACSALGGRSGGAPRVALLGRGSSFPPPRPRKARDTPSFRIFEQRSLNDSVYRFRNTALTALNSSASQLD